MNDKEIKSEIVIEGKTFIATHTDIGHAELLLDWFRRPKFSHYKPQIDESKNELQNIRQRIYARNHMTTRVEIELLIMDRKNHMPIGLAELTAIDRRNLKAEFSVGFIKRRGTRCVVEVLYHLFERIFGDMQLRKLIFHVSADNSNVLNLMEKQGFLREGVFQQELLIAQIPTDVSRYCLFKEQWNSSQLRTKLNQFIHS